jgi:hypothetical protein
MEKKQSIERKLRNFLNAAEELQEDWTNSKILKYKFVEKYPFKNSFDEVTANIREWVEHALDFLVCPRCGYSPEEEEDEQVKHWQQTFLEDNGLCLKCSREVEKNIEDGVDDINYWERCIMCGKWYTIGETGNELGFCVNCQKSEDFPYDLDAYYKDYDAGKVAFKGFDTMSRGILEPYKTFPNQKKQPAGFLDDALGRVEDVRNALYDLEEDSLAESLNQAHYSLQLLQENIGIVWEELYEVFADYEDMPDADLVRCKTVIKKRIEKAMEGLGNEFQTEEEK